MISTFMVSPVRQDVMVAHDFSFGKASGNGPLHILRAAREPGSLCGVKRAEGPYTLSSAGTICSKCVYVVGWAAVRNEPPIAVALDDLPPLRWP
jgi:hypothetical protein